MWEYPFEPTTKQHDAIRADVDEVLYGGALGGGKSELLLAACVTLCTLVPRSKSLLLRRSFPELNELVERLKERLPAGAATYNKSDHIFTFANGSQLILGFLDGEDDHERYQGAEYQLICFDELTHYRRKAYIMLLTRLRCTGEVARLMEFYGLKMRALSASNPGSRGHAWVKERFVDPAAKYTVFTGSDGTRRVFIPARLYDNPHIDHEEYLRKLGPMDPEMKRALIEGDWDIVSGVRFSQWRESLHVIDPEELPIPVLTGKRCVAVDYGFSAPFAALWMAKLADGLIVIYRELYRTELTARQQAELIRDSESDWETAAGRHRSIVMDPSMWRRNDATAGKPVDPDAPPVGSPAHDYQDVLGQTPVKAANARVHGWSRFDEKLRVHGDGLPRLLVYNTCREFIRTFPALPRDNENPEDVDTTSDDHLADAGRYGLMHLEGKSIKPSNPSRGGTPMITAGLGSKGF